MARLLVATLSALLFVASTVSGQSWPRYDARYTLEVVKVSGFEGDQAYWMHNHVMAGMPEALTVTVKVNVYEQTNRPPLDPALFPALQVRYRVKGVVVSGCVSQPWQATISADNPVLPVKDGVYDISVEICGGPNPDFKPHAAYFHLARPTPERLYDPLVPLLQHDQMDVDLAGPGVFYVDPAQRTWGGHPANPTVTPWQTPPYSSDLYLEPLTPSTALFQSAQMWWAQAGQPHRDKPFVRALSPKHSEDHRTLRDFWKHNRMPYRDGPRGIGWVSVYISGQVDSQGNLIAAEVGGRLVKLSPTGHTTTIAGWRVKPGKDPFWYEKPLSLVRENMENVGNWASGPGEFWTPLDVAIDPQNERIYYVASYEDQCIWKVDSTTSPATISVLAGSLSRQAGFANGTGGSARFNGPASLVFDPVADVLYVADQDNDAIRVVTRAGVVTTLAGSPGMQGRISGNDYDQLNARAQSLFETPAGTFPDIYRPQVIRVDSFGRIVLLELGYGAIRRIDPTTGQTVKLGEVRQPHTDGNRGWAWLDVDRWGNSGPLNGIYWVSFTGDAIDGEPSERRFNEIYAWLPPNGGTSRFIFDRGWPDSPIGVGRRDFTVAPHYPWLVAVDPRGAVLLAGAGQHGIERLRVRRTSDPLPASQAFWQGRNLWEGITRPDELRPQLMQFGYNAHNYLGLADAWGYTNATDQQILDAFEIPASMRNNPTERALILAYIRTNAGAPVPQTPQVTAPTNLRIIP